MLSLETINLASVDAEEYLHLLNLHIDQDEHPERMRVFFLKTKDPYSQCVGLEFMVMHGYLKDLRALIENNNQSEHALNREWARFYQLILKSQKKSIDYENLLIEMEVFKTEDIALKCIKLFMLISIHFRLRENGQVANVMDVLMDKIRLVEHPILQPLLRQRLELVSFNYYWKENQVILARKHGFIALDIITNPRYIANLHVNLGLSYIFDDFESAKYHLYEGLNLAKQKNFERVIRITENHNLPFIYAHFNQPDGITTPIKSEQAHLEIARGNLEKAQKILSEVTEDTPFTKYYLGRAYQDRSLLIQSYNEFLHQRSDHFFARLPLTALNEM